jgi:hypothetical protein
LPACGTTRGAAELARCIKQAVREATGLGCSIGIATNAEAT